MSHPNSHDELSLEFGRNLTGEIAPLESPFYDELISSLSQPKKHRKDQSLAFGVSPENGIASVALLAAGKIVVEMLWDAAKPMFSGLLTDAATELRKDFGAKLKKWIKSRFKEPVPVNLSKEGLSKIIDAAQEAARGQGLDEPAVGKLAKTLSTILS